MTQGFAVDRDDAFASLGEPRHEGLKACAEALGIELTEDTAERIVAREAAGEREKFAQECLLLLREIRHIHARLAPAEERAKRNQQQFMQIMPPRIARARIFKPRETGQEPFHRPTLSSQKA
jgi:hypothetical protein